MAHTCPTCDSQCYCDGEDTFIEVGDDDFECQHECEVEDFDDDGFEEDLTDAIAAIDVHECPRCTEPCECEGGTYNCTHACHDVVPSGDRQAVAEALVAPLFDTEKK